jgi:hypothetical protein
VEISQKIEQRPINSLEEQKANFTYEVFVIQKFIPKIRTKTKTK